jgi:chemotaxis signal transduction protein
MLSRQGGTAAEPSILLLHVHGRPLGLLVDKVHDLIHVPRSVLEDRGTLPGVDPRVVRAVGRWDDLVFVVLDPDVVLAPVFAAGDQDR